MMGSKSNGMILVADLPAGRQVTPEKFALLPLDKNLKNGTVIR